MPPLWTLAAPVVGALALFVWNAAERPIAHHSSAAQPELGHGGYDMQKVVAPRATGIMLRLFAALVSVPGFGGLLMRVLLNANDFHIVRGLAAQAGGVPIGTWPVPRLSAEEEEEHRQHAAARLRATPLGGAVLTLHDRYARGETDPVRELQRVLAGARGPLAPLNAFRELLDSAHAEARASKDRWARGKPLGIWDGVPVATKDEVAVRGTVLGEGSRPPPAPMRQTEEAEDDLAIARFRAAGAVLVGKTLMVEFGLKPDGFNVHYQGPFNPYNTAHLTGGSSSGSAAAVAAGLVPVAVGLDGGGSIRIPAALCGVHGLKATFSRIPFDAESSRTLSTVHAGPIAADAASAALAYELMAQPAPEGHVYREHYGGAGPPPPHTHRFNDVESLAGLRLGVFWPHFEDAAPEVVRAAKGAVAALQRRGAAVVEVRIPHLRALAMSHGIIIGSEMALEHDLRFHLGHPFQVDNRLQIGLFNAITSKEFLAAQRLRAWAMKWLRDEVFDKCDVYVTPAVGITAPRLDAAARSYGEENTVRTMELMRFIFLGNLAGNPGMVSPVGYEEGTGLPISLHMMGPHWAEAVLLRVANALQTLVPHRVPPHYHLEHHFAYLPRDGYTPSGGDGDPAK